ncbi:MAG: hypothetical protein SPL82_04530 [Lachnospiraceae bacterium]|jgi:hypothetical protein|nr:hypothetical protein [Lachnospiraceae bacterium]
MTDEEEKVICDFYAKEFLDTMPFDDISVKLDTLNSHPHIQPLRCIFCDNLVFALTEGFVKYDDASLVAYDGSLLKLVYENIEKLDKDNYFFWAFYYYLKKQYKKCKDNIHKVCSDRLKQGVLNMKSLFWNIFVIIIRSIRQILIQFRGI